MPVSEMESLRSFVAFSGGEVASETKPSQRKRAKITQDSNVREEEGAGKFINVALFTCRVISAGLDRNVILCRCPRSNYNQT